MAFASFNQWPQWLLSIDMYQVLAMVLVLVVMFIFYVRKKHRFWADQGIDGPPAMFFFGHFFELFQKDMRIRDEQYARKYGKIYGKYHLLTPVLKVAHPDGLRSIFAKDFYNFTKRVPIGMDMGQITKKMLNITWDSEWKRQRSVITTTFTSGKMRQMMPLMQSCLETSINQLYSLLSKSGSKTVEIDAMDFFEKLTLDIICMTCYSIEPNCHDPDSASGKEFMKYGRRLLDFKYIHLIRFLLYPMWLKKWTGFTSIKNESSSFFINVTREVIKRRRSAVPKQKHNDYLQILMDAAESSTLDARSDDSKAEKEILSLQDIGNEDQAAPTKTKNTSKFDDTDMIANAMMFFGIGFESTAPTLKYVFYALACNPDCQEKLYQEVIAFMAANPKGIDYEVIQEMKYLDQFVSETLRLYGILRVPRQAANDYTLEWQGKKIFVPKDTTCDLLLNTVHRDPDYWTEPQKFDPERFSPENKGKIVNYTYLPFGAGPRNCIGIRFGLLETKLTTIKLLAKFKIVKSPNTDVPLQFTEDTFNFYCNKVFVGVQRRD